MHLICVVLGMVSMFIATASNPCLCNVHPRRRGLSTIGPGASSPQAPCHTLLGRALDLHSYLLHIACRSVSSSSTHTHMQGARLAGLKVSTGPMAHRGFMAQLAMQPARADQGCGWGVTPENKEQASRVALFVFSCKLLGCPNRLL